MRLWASSWSSRFHCSSSASFSRANCGGGTDSRRGRERSTAARGPGLSLRSHGRTPRADRGVSHPKQNSGEQGGPLCQGSQRRLRSFNLEAVANPMSPCNVTGHVAPAKSVSLRETPSASVLPALTTESHTGHGSVSGPQRSLVLTSCLIHSWEGFKLNPKWALLGLHGSLMCFLFLLGNKDFMKKACMGYIPL